MPDGIAMHIPVTSPIVSPRDNISLVGQSPAPLLNEDVNPIAPPIATDISSARASFTDEDFANFQSFTLAPNVYLFLEKKNTMATSVN